ncbi:MAG: hypothetical protein ACXU93_08595, partial [Thermodesulfobacteriota bacterium]
MHKTEIKYRHKGGKWLPRRGRLIRLVIRRGGYIVDAETWQGILDIDLLTKLVKAGSHEKAKALLLEKVKATKRGNSLRST